MPYLAGYVTPQDYGATGNGTTDDTAAVQAALTAVGAAGGGTLYVPPGTYLLSSALSAGAGVSLLGAGPGVSVLSQSSTGANGITYNPTALSGISVSGLSIVGPGSGSGVGLLIEANGGGGQATSCVVENVAVKSMGSHGVQIVNGSGCSVSGLNVSSLGGNGVTITGSGNSVSACTGGATVVLTGTVAQAATVSATGNVQVGTASSLGDNGAGELQLANATTVPTTNPTGGVALYAQSSTPVPVRIRDTAGNVRGLVDAVALATANQSTTSTSQTASTYLTIAVEANATYLMEESLIFSNSSASGTLATSFTGPSGATMQWNDTSTSTDYAATIGATNSYTGSTSTRMGFLKGTLVVGSTSGSFTATFSASSSTTSTIYSGSTLKLTRIK